MTQAASALSPVEQAELDILQAEGMLFQAESEQILKARTNLLDFTRYTKPDYEVSWHHKVVCGYLDAFAMGQIKRLMIFMPPRNGKSELVSRRFPAYLLGLDPNRQIALASYASSLASSMCLDVQNIMDEPRYHRIFPKSQILQKGMEFEGKPPKRQAEYFEMVRREQFGYMKTVGVGGGLTGFGFSDGIIDDPFKNREEADSDTTRESIWKWYNSVFHTRMNSEDASICITLTRWHEDGLEGRLLEQAKSDARADQWIVLELPAEFEEGNDDHPINRNDKRTIGQPLWPTRYSKRYLDAQRIASPRDFAALHQQRPYTEGGMILKKHWWRYYLPPGHDKPAGLTELECHVFPRYYDELILSVDCSFKDFDTSDNVAIQVWARKGPDKYLVDQVVDEQGRPPKLDFVDTCKAIVGMLQKHPRIRAKLIEDKANGSAVISKFKRKISGIIPIEPEGGKVARARAVSDQIESGNVYLPIPEACPWINNFVDECAKFPKGKYDDQVDACTQALFRLETNEGLDIRLLSEW